MRRVGGLEDWGAVTRTAHTKSRTNCYLRRNDVIASRLGNAGWLILHFRILVPEDYVLRDIHRQRRLQAICPVTDRLCVPHCLISPHFTRHSPLCGV